MSQKLYYTDAFTRNFTATVVEQVTSNGRFAVILDQTFFYPTSGGQPHDTGTLAGVSVVDVTLRESDGAVLHWLETAVSLPPQISAAIDWERRFDHMQQHTGQHILSQAFLRVAEAQTVGFHLSPNSVTIDLDTAQLGAADVARAEQIANEIIWQNRPIRVKMVTPDEAAALPLRRIPNINEETLRLIEIEDFDLTACGGTHVSAAGAVGQIKVLRTENNRGQTRVEFCCGQRALQDYQQKHTIVATLSTLFTTGVEEVIGSVERLQTANKEAQRTIRRQQEALLAVDAANLLQTAQQIGPWYIVTAVRHDTSPAGLRALAQQLVQHENVVALLALHEARAAFVFARSENAPGDMRALLQTTLAQTNAGSGGGSPQMAQGGGPAAPVAALENILNTAVSLLTDQISPTRST